MYGTSDAARREHAHRAGEPVTARGCLTDYGVEAMKRSAATGAQQVWHAAREDSRDGRARGRSLK